MIAVITAINEAISCESTTRQIVGIATAAVSRRRRQSTLCGFEVSIPADEATREPIACNVSSKEIQCENSPSLPGMNEQGVPKLNLETLIEFLLGLTPIGELKPQSDCCNDQDG